jgi:hypothetical protein
MWPAGQNGTFSVHRDIKYTYRNVTGKYEANKLVTVYLSELCNQNAPDAKNKEVIPNFVARRVTLLQ